MLSNIDIRYFKLCCPDIGVETQVDISARCPICGDSKTNKKTKRLHLYERDGKTFVHCFNGGCSVNTNMYGFIKHYFPEHLFNYRREVFGEKVLSEKPSTEKKSPEKSLQETSFRYIHLESLLDPLNQKCIDYINSRGLTLEDCSKFGKWFYGKQDILIDDKLFKIKDKIIIPFYRDSKIYGFYSRSLDKKEFKSCNINQDYKIWNWFNIDKSQPVFIFEGIFDAISSGKTNIIALCGVDIPKERLKELENPIFCLDNDSTGINKMISYAKENYKVLVYPESFNYKDLNSAKQSGVSLDFNIMSGFRAVIELKKLL